MGKLFVFCLTLFMAIGLTTYAQDAQDNEFEPEGMDYMDVDYAYGTAIKVDIAKNEMTVKQYDGETDMDIEVTYSIDPAVEVEDAPSWREIAPGSSVDIEYIEQDSKKIIKYISVFKEEIIE